MTPNSSPVRPPILRFLLLFAALLCTALGLAALSPAVPADGADAAAVARPANAPAQLHQPR